MKRLLFLVLFLTLLASPALASEPEEAVLLPVAGPLTPDEKQGLADELVKNLSGRYEVIYGADVDKYVTEVFLEESKKDECDAEACYRKIAQHYGVETIIALRVAPKGDSSYLLSFSVYDVLEGKIIEEKRLDCDDCSYEGLKGLCSKLAWPGKVDK
ncbi:MAG: hypothetical protein IMF07_03635 [Proteobacteria bacterium]|nr:hypothetical protein [Pseudomonadota bacterium]